MGPDFLISPISPQSQLISNTTISTDSSKLSSSAIYHQLTTSNTREANEKILGKSTQIEIIQNIKPEELSFNLDSHLINKVADYEKILEKIKNHSESSSSTESLLLLVQKWVADGVFRGGSLTARVGVPLFLNTTAESMPDLKPVTEGIVFATDMLDMGSGFAGSIYKKKILKIAEQEVKKLKSKSSHLNPEQLDRLEQIEKSIKYSKSLLSSQENEQFVRMSRNFFSYLDFSISWFRNLPLIAHLSTGAHTIVAGLNSVLYGFYFYRAHKELKAHESWSNEFKQWVKEKTLIIDHIKSNGNKFEQNIHEALNKIAIKRKRSEKISVLKDQIQKDETQRDLIYSKLMNVEFSKLQRYVHHIALDKTSYEQFQTQLERMLNGVKLDKEPILYLYQDLLNLKEFSSKENIDQSRIEIIKNKIEKSLKNCCAKWMESKDEEQLLSHYVDYQSVLDPTIKNALTEMIQKKHEVEKSFLKLKKTHYGTQFTAATIIFGVTLTLAIIGLAFTPVGPAALILTILTVASLSVSLGLIGGGFYLSFQKKPALTAATLKGAYLRISIYSTLSKIYTLEDEMTLAMKQNWQLKRNQLADYIDQLPILSRLFPRKSQVDNRKELAIIKEENDKHFQEVKSLAKQFADKATQLKNELEELSWKDFAKQANLKVVNRSSLQQNESSFQSFDTLERINEAINQLDFNLLSNETKELLSKQLGINIYALQASIEKDPTVSKQLLHKFFNLDAAGLVKFVGEQRFMDKI